MIAELVDYNIEYASNGDVIINATAIVEDAVLMHYSTIDSPEEYGPALCETRLNLFDYEGDLSESHVLELLEFYADWSVCEPSGLGE